MTNFIERKRLPEGSDHGRLRLSWRNSNKTVSLSCKRCTAHSNGYALQRLCQQWFSVRLSSCRLSFCFFFNFFSSL